MIKWEWVQERHEYWCEKLEQFTGAYARGHKLERFITALTAGSVRPTIERDLIRPRVAGHYHPGKNLVVINSAYLIVMGEAYNDDTVAHEACHAYQRYFEVSKKPNRWPAKHGELFYFMLRNVCGKTHSHVTKEQSDKIRKVHNLLAMQANIAAKKM